MPKTTPMLVLATLAALAGSSPRAQAPVAAPAAIVEHLDLQYAEASSDARRNQLDLYLPAGPGPHPVAIFFHGGAWTVGNKDMHAFVGRYLAQHGFAAAVPNYRLHPFARWTAIVGDAAAAVAFTVANSAAYGLDRDRVFLLGHSAGGHLAGMLAFQPKWLQAAGAGELGLCGLVGLSGAYDVRPPYGPLMQIFGTAPAERRSASPIVHAAANAPPTLLVWADNDALKLDVGSRMLAARLRGAGVSVTAREVKGHHVDYLFALQRPGGGELGPLLLEFLRARCRQQDVGDPPAAAAIDVRRELPLGTAAPRLDLFLPRPPSPTAHWPLLAVAARAGDTAAWDHAAARWAAAGVAVAIVGCRPTAAHPGGDPADLAAAGHWLATRSADLRFDGRTTVLGIGDGAAIALALATEPEWLEQNGLTTAAITRVLAIARPQELAIDADRLREHGAKTRTSVLLPYADPDDGAMRALAAQLAFWAADLVLLPLGDFDAAACLAGVGTADDELTPLVLGFAGG